jgi:hypothetical protein
MYFDQKVGLEFGGNNVLRVSTQPVDSLMEATLQRGMFMDSNRSLYIPVILGTARMGRMSEHAARLVTEELGKCTDVETDLIDIAKLPPTHERCG